MGVDVNINVASVRFTYVYAGGLAGNVKGTIENSYATGNVGLSASANASAAAFAFAGGLAGYVEGTTENSYATGNVRSSASTPSGFESAHAGGLAGYVEGTIENSYATGNVTAGSEYAYAGGLAGGVLGTIENSYATGNVGSSTSKYAYAGGLAGHVERTGTIENSYATGNVTARATLSSARAYARGLAGIVLGIIEKCYFNSTNENNGCGTPATLTELKLQSTYIGWDFDTIWAIDSNINNGYPYLRALNYNKTEKTDTISSFTLDSTSTVEVGNSAYFSGKITLNENEEASNEVWESVLKEIKWTSSDESVAVVKSCTNVNSYDNKTATLMVTVDAKKEGTATITGTTKYGLSASCVVTVEESTQESHITGVLSAVDELGFKVTVGGKIYDVTEDFSMSNAKKILLESSSKMVAAVVEGKKISCMDEIEKICIPKIRVDVSPDEISVDEDGNFAFDKITAVASLYYKVQSPYTSEDMQGVDTMRMTVGKVSFTVEDGLSLDSGSKAVLDQSLDANLTVVPAERQTVSQIVYVADSYKMKEMREEKKITVKAETSAGTLEDSGTVLFDNGFVKEKDVKESVERFDKAIEKYVSVISDEANADKENYMDGTNSKGVILRKADEKTTDRFITFEKDIKLTDIEIDCIYQALAKYIDGLVKFDKVSISTKDKKEETAMNIINAISVNFSGNSENQEISTPAGTVKIISYGGVNAAFTGEVRLNGMRVGQCQTTSEDTYNAMVDYLEKWSDTVDNLLYQSLMSVFEELGSVTGISEFVKTDVENIVKDHVNDLMKAGYGKDFAKIYAAVQQGHQLLESVKTVLTDKNIGNLLSNADDVLNKLEKLDLSDSTVKNILVKDATDEVYRTKDDLFKTLYAYVYGTKKEKPSSILGKMINKFNINCPVDFVVYGADGKILGSVRNGVTYFEPQISIRVNGNTKTVWCDAGEDIKIVFTGTGDGEMNYVLQQMQNGAVINRVNYYGVPLKAGVVYSQTIDKNVTLAEDDSPVLICEDDKTVINGKYQDVKAEPELITITITASTGGIVSGDGSYEKGSVASVNAEPDEGYLFAGWHKDGALVESDRIYYLAAVKNTELEARFEKKLVIDSDSSVTKGEAADGISIQMVKDADGTKSIVAYKIDEAESLTLKLRKYTTANNTYKEEECIFAQTGGYKYSYELSGIDGVSKIEVLDTEGKLLGTIQLKIQESDASGSSSNGSSGESSSSTESNSSNEESTSSGSTGDGVTEGGSSGSSTGEDDSIGESSSGGLTGGSSSSTESNSSNEESTSSGSTGDGVTEGGLSGSNGNQAGGSTTGTTENPTVGTKTADSKTETVTQVKKNSKGKTVRITTTTKKDAKGNVESVTVKIEIEASSKTTSTVVTVKKNGKGEILSAAAAVNKTVTGKKATLEATVISQIVEAAGTKDVTVTMIVRDKDKNVKYRVKSNIKHLKKGNVLYIYKLNTKTGKHTMVNAKSYEVKSGGAVTVSMDKKVVYELVSASDAAKINKDI